LSIESSILAAYESVEMYLENKILNFEEDAEEIELIILPILLRINLEITDVNLS